MIDLDEIERILNDETGRWHVSPDAISKLIAEVRALRERNQLTQNVVLYADSVCGMLRQGGWPGKAEALESRVKAVIDFDKDHA